MGPGDTFSDKPSPKLTVGVVVSEAASGLKTGLKSTVNAAASTVVSTVTLGGVSNVEPWAVNQEDLDAGYGLANKFSRFGTELFVVAATGKANQVFTVGTAGGYGAKTVAAVRTAQPFLFTREAVMTYQSGKETVKALQEGDGWGALYNGSLTALGGAGSYLSGKNALQVGKQWVAYVAPSGGRVRSALARLDPRNYAFDESVAGMFKPPLRFAPLANASQTVTTRVGQLQAAIPAAQQGRITMAVAVVEDANGARSLLVSSSEGAYIRGPVRPVVESMGAQVVGGTGHAEANIIAHAQGNNLRVIDIGATRPVCVPCQDVIAPTGANISTPLRPRPGGN
jgi:hypothetical protein